METCCSAPCFGGPELPTDAASDGDDWQNKRHGFRDSTPVRQKLSLPAAGGAALRAARARPDLDARHDDVDRRRCERQGQLHVPAGLSGEPARVDTGHQHCVGHSVDGGPGDGAAFYGDRVAGRKHGCSHRFHGHFAAVHQHRLPISHRPRDRAAGDYSTTDEPVGGRRHGRHVHRCRHRQFAPLPVAAQRRQPPRSNQRHADCCQRPADQRR